MSSRILCIKHSLRRTPHHTKNGKLSYVHRCNMQVYGIRVKTAWTNKPPFHHIKFVSGRAKILNAKFELHHRELMTSSPDSISMASSSSWHSRSPTPPLIRAKTPPPPLMSVTINKELVEHAARVKNLPSLLQGMKLSDMNMAGPSHHY